MTRRKVVLAYIANDSERKASYKKRKKGLIKKVKEITVLCDVEACAIIYSPYHPDEPEIWPSKEGAVAVIERFRRLSEMEQVKKMLNQDSFTRQRIRKLEENQRRAQKENKRLELEIFMFQCIAGLVSIDSFDISDAAEMSWVIKQILREVGYRIQDLKMGATGGSEKGLAPLKTVVCPEKVYSDGFGWRLGEESSGGSGGYGGEEFGWCDVMAAPPSPYFVVGNGGGGNA